MILSRRSFDSVPVRLRMTDEDVARFAVHRFEFPGLDIKTRQTRHYPYGELARACAGLRRRHQRAGSRAHRPRRLRRHRADRQARRRERLRARSCTAATATARSWSTRKGARCSARARSRRTLRTHAPTRRRGPGALDRSEVCSKSPRSALGDHRGAVVAHRSAAMAMCSRSPAARDSIPTMFARGITRANTPRCTENIDKPLLNRALRGTYPSGSTIKPVIALAGLTYHVLDPDKASSATASSICPAARTCSAKARPGAHGLLDLQEAIASSCDVYFYGLAATMGVDRHRRFMAPFGYRHAHRHRHQRREGRACCRRPTGRRGVQTARGPDLVSRRDGELRHRPGLSAGHAAAAGAHRRRHRRRAARIFDRAW